MVPGKLAVDGNYLYLLVTTWGYWVFLIGHEGFGDRYRDQMTPLSATR